MTPIPPTAVVGHEAEHHNSGAYAPMLMEALGRDGIWFDYVTTPAAAFGDADFLANYDAVLAENDTATPVSPMPPMTLILKPQEFEDIKAFLGTLK